ncbi:hypothetical protein BDZ89DRAFT_1065121 [Hymenopellis radicata]|nr:hypothetical protein BDZ89DRAFT_1065121 [Hymenopellis radicata]
MPKTKAHAASDNAAGASKKQRRDQDDASAATLTRIATLLQEVMDAAKTVKDLPTAGLPDLRRARGLAAALLTTLPPDPAIEEIKIVEHKGRIETKLSKLRSSCASDWHDGYETQWEYMEQICAEIGKWLPAIWNAFETGSDFQIVRTAIVYCTQTVDAIWDCESRAEFSDASTKVTIQNAAGQTIYKSSRHISDALKWFWRELLISDASQQSDPSSSAILADLEENKMTDKVFRLLAAPVSDGTKTSNRDRKDSFNKHWTPEMHDVAQKLVSGRENKRIARFLEQPTLGLYNQVVTPALKPSLLAAVRKDLAAGRSRKMAIEDAVEIFRMNDLLDDIVPLLPQVYNDKTRRAVAKALSGEQVKKEYREEGLKILENGLRRAKDAVIGELQQVLPGLDEAQDWLAEEVFPKFTEEDLLKARDPPYDETGRKLENAIDKFIKIAKRGDGDEYYRRGYDSANSEGGEGPELARDIMDWLQLLGEWPKEAEAAAAWDKVRWENSAGPFGMNGIMSSLGYEFEEKRWYLSEGIRTVNKVFACADMEALSKYIPKTTTSGSFTFTSRPLILT